MSIRPDLAIADPPTETGGASRPRVLLDGYNLALPQGTGVRTFTRLLRSALTALGAETGLFYGRALNSGLDDPLLPEVQFHDGRPPRLTRIANRLRRYESLSRALLNVAPAARPLSAGAVAPAPGAPEGPAFNAQGLYDIAFRRSHIMRRDLDVTPPGPFDVFHLTFPLPIQVRGGTRKIVTIHDLIPLRAPYLTLDDKAETLGRHRRAVADADLLFTVSEHSKSDLVELLGVDPDRIAVVHQPSRFSPLNPAERERLPRVLERFGLADQGYVLFVGAIEPKKNLARLTRAYAEADVDRPLVVVGRRAWLWQDEIGWLEQASDRIRAKIRCLDHVAEDDLRFLYAGASALTFPSLYEGYGLPLVEAMAFGLPVLTSHSACMPQVCGPAALYVDPLDVMAMSRAIEQLVGDTDLRAKLAAAGLRRTAELSPQAFAQDVAAGYRRLGFFT